MSRKFKTADYEATLNSTVTLRDCLPPDHVARFIADVITQLDLGAIYAHYGPRGGEAIAPARPSRRKFFWVCCFMATPQAPSAPARLNERPMSRCLSLPCGRPPS